MNTSNRTSILVVASRTPADRSLLDKAVLIAGRLGCRIHLFACDAELADILRHSCAQEDVEKTWQLSVSDHRGYLEALRASTQAADIDISIDATCDSPHHEAIIRKIRSVRPNLVMKSASGAHPLRRFTLGPNDWQLMRACPVTLMLVRGNRWRESPRFAALVDVSEEETPGLAEAILRTSEHFSLGCRADLDVIYSEPEAGVACERRAGTLSRLVTEYRVDAPHVHVLSGDPDVTLPDFAAKHLYDVLVLGALTHRKGIAALVGTLTARLVETLPCDFILVKIDAPERLSDEEEPAVDPDALSAKQSQRAAGRDEKAVSGRDVVLWQALFGD